MLMYVFASILLAFYLLIAGFALYMTYDEQIKTHNSNLFLKLVSFVACVAWPVTLLIVVVAVFIQPAARQPA